MNLYEIINTDNIKDGVYRLFFDIEADSKPFMDEYDTDAKKEEIIYLFSQGIHRCIPTKRIKILWMWSDYIEIRKLIKEVQLSSNIPINHIQMYIWYEVLCKLTYAIWSYVI